MAIVRDKPSELVRLLTNEHISEITLNGGIVSNKGFIKQFAAPGTKVINGDYVSAWGGIQSAGQFLGQMVCVAHALQSSFPDPKTSSSGTPWRLSAASQHYLSLVHS